MIWWHIHVRKCGGTSIRRWLDSVHPNGHWSQFSLSEGGLRSVEYCREITSGNESWLKSYSDHQLSCECLHVPDTRAFAVVRHPAARFVSNYRFFRKFRTENPAMDMSLDEYLENQLVQCNGPMVHLSQMYHVSHGKGMSTIEQWVDDGRLILLPFGMLNRLPQITGLGGNLPHVNRSEPGLEADSKTIQRITDLSQPDLHLFEYACEVARQYA